MRQRPQTVRGLRTLLITTICIVVFVVLANEFNLFKG
jgi:hypothetical protein